MHYRMNPAVDRQRFAAHFRHSARDALAARRKTFSRGGIGALGLLFTGLMALSGCALLTKTEEVSLVEPAPSSHGGGGAQAFMLAPGNNAGGSGASAPVSGSVGTTDAASTAGTTGMMGTAGTLGAAACDSLAGLGECGNTTIAADIRTVNILLVIDKSGSMTDEPQGFEVNRWRAELQRKQQLWR
jgi:hypothetical protein